MIFVVLLCFWVFQNANKIMVLKDSNLILRMKISLYNYCNQSLVGLLKERYQFVFPINISSFGATIFLGHFLLVLVFYPCIILHFLKKKRGNVI